MGDVHSADDTCTCECDPIVVTCSLCTNETVGDIFFTADNDPMFIVCESCYDDESFGWNENFTANIKDGRFSKCTNARCRNVHTGIVCDVCNMNPIRGARYKCTVCDDYDICGKCKNEGPHAHHPLREIVFQDCEEVSTEARTEDNNNNATLKESQQSGDGSVKVTMRVESASAEGLDDLKQRMTCPVCLDLEKTVAFKCGHSTCSTCSPKLKKCPICQMKITTRIKLYH